MYTFLDNMFKVLKMAANNEQQKDLAALAICGNNLETPSLEDAVEVRNYILANWESFKMIYKSTGAQYTTLKRVKTIFGLNEN